MYLPKPYKAFMDQFPEVFKNYEALGKVCRDAGPLDEKVQNLIKLGMAVGVNSRGAVMSATRKSLASGATQEEVYHVILMSLPTIGFPTMISSLNWVNEVLESKE